MSGQRPPILALTRLIGTAGAVILAAGIAAPLGGCGSEPGGAGADYDVRGAAQVSAVAAMIEHLTAAP